MGGEALTWLPNLLQNYIPSQEGVAHSQFIKMMIIFSIAFITVLILKVRAPQTRLWEGWGARAAQAPVTPDCQEAGVSPAVSH